MHPFDSVPHEKNVPFEHEGHIYEVRHVCTKEQHSATSGNGGGCSYVHDAWHDIYLKDGEEIRKVETSLPWWFGRD